MLLGDFNARVGQNNHNRSRVMGTHALGDITDNGERLISLYEENDFVIGGTLFPHKTIHKLTWSSPDGNTRSQIDHIMINGKWRHFLQDVRAISHADVGSDHNLVVAKVLLKLRKPQSVLTRKGVTMYKNSRSRGSERNSTSRYRTDLACYKTNQTSLSTNSTKP